MAPLTWLKAIRPRYQATRRLQGGSFIVRGSRGQTLVRGGLKTTLLTVRTTRAPVIRRGRSRQLQIYLQDGSLALEYPIRPMVLGKKKAYLNREVRIV